MTDMVRALVFLRDGGGSKITLRVVDPIGRGLCGRCAGAKIIAEEARNMGIGEISCDPCGDTAETRRIRSLSAFNRDGDGSLSSLDGDCGMVRSRRVCQVQRS